MKLILLLPIVAMPPLVENAAWANPIFDITDLRSLGGTTSMANRVRQSRTRLLVSNLPSPGRSPVKVA
jgi:hypothetical protein